MPIKCKDRDILYTRESHLTPSQQMGFVEDSSSTTSVCTFIEALYPKANTTGTFYSQIFTFSVFFIDYGQFIGTILSLIDY